MQFSSFWVLIHTYSYTWIEQPTIIQNIFWKITYHLWRSVKIWNLSLRYNNGTCLACRCIHVFCARQVHFCIRECKSVNPQSYAALSYCIQSVVNIFYVCINTHKKCVHRRPNAFTLFVIHVHILVHVY